MSIANMNFIHMCEHQRRQKQYGEILPL